MQRREQHGMSRRQFTEAGVMAMLAGVVVTLSDCGSSSPTTPSSPPPSTGGGGDVTGSISANHGHTAVITRAQLTAGGAINLDIRGTATHPHTVSLSQSEVVAIAAGQRVSKTSSSDSGHMHDVTFN
jgi:hypothetical protein